MVINETGLAHPQCRCVSHICYLIFFPWNLVPRILWLFIFHICDLVLHLVPYFSFLSLYWIGPIYFPISIEQRGIVTQVSGHWSHSLVHQKSARIFCSVLISISEVTLDLTIGQLVQIFDDVILILLDGHVTKSVVRALLWYYYLPQYCSSKIKNNKNAQTTTDLHTTILHSKLSDMHDAVFICVTFPNPKYSWTILQWW